MGKDFLKLPCKVSPDKISPKTLIGTIHHAKSKGKLTIGDERMSLS